VNPIILLVLMAAFLVLLIYVFHPPFPSIGRLLAFLALLAIGAIMAYMFVIYIFDYDPDPLRLRIANGITDNKIVDLTQIVPGLPEDLELIQRLDTDNDPDDGELLEWAVLYRYDTVVSGEGAVSGPYGAAIYDVDRCRPPAIQSYELAPANYDYLAQTWATVGAENMIEYKDPLSSELDRPEVIVRGLSPGQVLTDLNIFRKVGIEPNCLEVQAWRQAHPGQAFPYGDWLRYDNIGSFRGNYEVRRDGQTVSVFDRGPFERSQIVIRKDYRPRNGSYLYPGTQTLLDPVEYRLTFGKGAPTDVPEVYYPEKAVLAFYELLGKDQASLDQAKTYLSPGAQDAYDIDTDTFGLSADSESVAQARSKLDRALVLEIRYVPDRDAERLHEDRQVTVIVVGANKDGGVDYAHPCTVTWRIIAEPNPQALPYGCEWRLDRYQSSCPGPGEHGELPAAESTIGWLGSFAN